MRILDLNKLSCSKLTVHRYCQPLSEAHGEDTLVKFEELLEAALDLDRLPEEYLVGTHDCTAKLWFKCTCSEKVLFVLFSTDIVTGGKYGLAQKFCGASINVQKRRSY